MARQKITVIPGDGIGPEIVDVTIQILDKLDCGFEYEFADAGKASLEREGSPLPERTLKMMDKNRITIKGPLTTPSGYGYDSVNVFLRKHFNLYTSIRPAQTFPNTASRYSNVDIITVRENTEGMYSGEGQTLSPDGSRAEAVSVVTRKGSVQILDAAYYLAKRLGRKKMTIVHKANIMKTTSGLFLEVARTLAQKHPEITTEEMIVDKACMQLVMSPEQFDLIVTTNLFGDIISDICAGLIGGLGLAPGANIGDQHALFETVHGTADSMAGKNRANPSSMILASAMMLEYLQLPLKARIIRKALRDVYESRDRLTPDMGGDGSTIDFSDAIMDRI